MIQMPPQTNWLYQKLPAIVLPSGLMKMEILLGVIAVVVNYWLAAANADWT
jgi:hypothetical protein